MKPVAKLAGHKRGASRKQQVSIRTDHGNRRPSKHSLERSRRVG